MSAVVDFRVFQTARDQAQRTGIPQSQAVHRVAEAIRGGGTGQHVCEQYRAAAYRAARDHDDDPRPAA